MKKDSCNLKQLSPIWGKIFFLNPISNVNPPPPKKKKNCMNQASSSMVSAYRAHPTCQRFSGQDRHGREGRQFRGVGRRVDNQSRLTSLCVLVVWLVTGRSDAVDKKSVRGQCCTQHVQVTVSTTKWQCILFQMLLKFFCSLSSVLQKHQSCIFLTLCGPFYKHVYFYHSMDK